MKKKAPKVIPDVILVAAHGILHFRGFGLASHLGVLADVPTIGVGKNMLYFDGMRPEKVMGQVRRLKPTDNFFKLVGNTGKTYGVAMIVGKTDAAKRDPVWVSPGHRISVRAAADIAMACCGKTKGR